MTDKLYTALVRGALGAFALFVGVGIWYYCWGRHPHIVVSQKLNEKAPEPACLRIGPNELLVVSGDTARLFDTAAGKEKWNANLAAATPGAATPSSTAAVPAATPADPRVAKLTAWRDDLTARREKLKTAQEIKAFNADAARYHAELALFRGQATPAPANARKARTDEKPGWDDEILRKRTARETDRVKAQAEKVADLKAKAKTDFQRRMAQEEAARLEAAQSALARVANNVTDATHEMEEPERLALKEDDEGDDRFSRFDQPRTEIFAQPSQVWVVRGKEALAIDRIKGQITKKLALPGTAERTWAGSTALYILVEAGSSQQIVRIAGQDAAMTSQPLTARCEPRHFEMASSPPRERSTAFSLSGDTLLQMSSHLLEKKITERKAMRGSSTEDWEKADRESHGGWANDAALIAQAMENDAKRDLTNGVEKIDESTYEVSITQPFANAKPVWSGTLTGAPFLYSLPSVELLFCGARVLALDHTGKQVWETKLAWEISPGTESPCLEASGSIYLHDRAFLTALERASGKVLWRLPSVGIQKVCAEPEGALFVCTQNLPADAARFSQESQLAGKQDCSVLKVDAKSGKVLWNAPKYEDCFVSAGAVYAARQVQNATDPAEQVFARKGPTTRFLLFKLSNDKGTPQWQWLQMKRPLQVEPEGRKVSLLFADEFQSLKSFAL